MLRNFLRNTIRKVSETIGINSFPICRFADLGQTFDNNGDVLNQNLRQTRFSDESGTQWIVSFILLEDNKTIIINSLKQSKIVVKETISIKESQLRQIIRESIEKILNNI